MLNRPKALVLVYLKQKGITSGFKIVQVWKYVCPESAISHTVMQFGCPLQ